MDQPFEQSAESLYSFFSQAGRGFYIPYYQRPYSWDYENAEQLISDIFRALERLPKKPKNSIFLGTVILHDLRDIRTGNHTDTPNLLTKVSNVVDGQQRIISIGLLSCVLSQIIGSVESGLRSLGGDDFNFGALAIELENQKAELLELYSVEIKKAGSMPTRKPLIIRAGDVSSQPVNDQWTLKGDPKKFYVSNTASCISNFISNTKFEEITADERIKNILDVFKMRIESNLNALELEYISKLLEAFDDDQSNLHSFMDYPPSIEEIKILENEQRNLVLSGIQLLAFCHFFKKCCHLVVIECKDEDIAFDMFQALNATGTPLTAFEVFKPVVVKCFSNDYPNSAMLEIDRIEEVFQDISTANKKEELTDKILVASAFVYSGSLIAPRFSDERDWLLEAFDDCNDDAQRLEFITLLADQSEYYYNIVKPRRSPKGSNNFSIVTHLRSLGFNDAQANITGLCLVFLKDANHKLAHSVLSVFYSKLLKAIRLNINIPFACDEFEKVSKATAAFFTLWMGALPARFPDADYKTLFQSANNLNFLSGQQNQTSTFVISSYKDALAKKGVYDLESKDIAKKLWVSEAVNTAWYTRRTVCRFALMAAYQDAAPDTLQENAGLYVNGMKNSLVLLTPTFWHAIDYEVIEHVATRKKPANIKHPNHFDLDIYPGNDSVVDKIGNLTLLSVNINSSLYSEWPDKAYYFWHLSKPEMQANPKSKDDLKTALGLTKIPAGLENLSAASNYLPHLAPLALRGALGFKWNSEFIKVRSKNICERVFNNLSDWL
jgi:hypothetical protein